jgi:dephospho-CoA kinase
MGKSTVLGMFGELGAHTISTDGIVAELLEEKAVLEKVREIFSGYVFDMNGNLLKDRVARVIFMDRHRKEALEALLHPLVFERMEEVLKAVGEKVVVVEIPLLFEGGYGKRFSKTVAVYADLGTVVERLGEKGVSRDDILMRHCCQMPVQEKVRCSDFAIDNNGSREDTARQVREVYDKLLGEA